MPTEELQNQIDELKKTIKSQENLINDLKKKTDRLNPDNLINHYLDPSSKTRIQLIVREGYFNGSLVWNPGNLVDGAGETSSSITIKGASLGDFVQVSAPYDLQGILAHAYVDATNSVKIRIQNETGGAIDLASGTWKVIVYK